MTQHKLVTAVAKGGGGPESNMIDVFVIVGIHHLVRLEITTAVTSFNLFFYTTSKRNCSIETWWEQDYYIWL